MGFFRRIFSSLTLRERRIFFIAVGCFFSALVVAILFTVLNNSGSLSGTNPFIEGVVGQLKDPNPVLATSDIDRSIVRLVFSNLFDLSTSIEEHGSTPGSGWRVRLRDDATWHDGVRVTSDDVLFTIARIQEDGSGSPLASVWRGVKVSRISELEIEITIPSSYVFFPDNFQTLFIAPKHIYADVPTSNWRLSDYHFKPVGSGMYQFDSYDILPNGFVSAYRLRAAPHYFGKRPTIDRLNFSFYPNPTELYRAFDAGALTAFGAPNLAYDQNIRRPFATHQFPLPSYYAIFFNQSKAPILADPVVRRAISLSINTQRIVTDALLTHGTVVDFPIADPLASSTLFSPEEAMKLLDGRGWQRTASGTRQISSKAGTQSLAFTLLVPDVDFLKTTASYIRDDLAQVGITATITVAGTADINANAIKNRNYEALLFGNSLGVSPDLFAFWHSSARFSPGLNIALYANKQVDTLLENIRRTPDVAERSMHLARLRSLIISDMPAVFLFSTSYNYITATTVSGITTQTITDPSQRFLGVNNWSVKGFFGL
jgi:peptide/nickel transport system substrate-binding protein